MNNKLEKNVICKKRTPDDLLETVLRCISDIKTPADRKDYLLRKGLYKVLVEEIYPIAIFCKGFFEGTDILVQPILGSQSYDAMIYYQNDTGEKTQYLEVTQAIEGYEDRIQRELLAEGLPAPFTGHFMVDRKSKKIKSTLHAESIHHLMAKIQKLCLSAIEKKLEIKYESGTILLVVIKSLPIISTSQIGNSIKKILKTSFLGKDCRFSNIFLVNSAEEVEPKFFCVWKNICNC